MTNSLYLNENFSTTRLLVQQKPEGLKNPHDRFETVHFLPEGENRKGEGGLRTKGYFKQSYPDKPLISIITVVYNGEKYLEETIRSVLKQTYDNVEYIIIDGGSTDGTLDIIRKYEDQIDYWVSEQDRGISDAFNKGQKLCSGKYHIFINADDTIFNTNILHSLEKNFSENHALICGNCILQYDSFDKLVKAKHQSHFYKMPTTHQAMFFNTLFCKNKLYSVSNRLTMDYEFFLKYLQNEDVHYIDVIISKMRMSGVSQNNICKSVLSYISLNIEYSDFIAMTKSVLYAIKACIYNMRIFK